MRGLPSPRMFYLENCQVFPSRPTGSIAKGVYPLWGSFDLENGPVNPSGPTDSKTKVLTNIHEKFQQKQCRNFVSPKDSWTITQEIRQNEGFTCYGIYLTMKMGRFARRDQKDP
ncbi:hypothetical protein H5410_056560 [Solanum commersonii]|uniref:Uncharacterized protein n=1 Tax=Solanum commersonii TaxID=4109 RepID=A0A9J5WLN1_SOLCO|nr:hypothetical protein H5410_056560 [Solanum commersonii]